MQAMDQLVVIDPAFRVKAADGLDRRVVSRKTAGLRRRILNAPSATARRRGRQAR